MRPRERRGFTLVELLVVIGIIAMLISLLLPAVQAVRESSRRLSCSNNLHQLAMAVKNYETNESQFPAAGLVNSSGDFNPRSGVMMSWIVLILPQLDQTSLYDRFTLTQSVLQQATNPQETFLPALICPSDSGQGRSFQHNTLTSGKRFAKGNYAAFVSPYHVEFQAAYPGGLVGIRNYTQASVRDGLGNTFMLSEVRTRASEVDQRGAWALPWTGSTLLAFDMHHGGSSGAMYQHSSVSRGQTQLPNNQGPNMDMLYDCSAAAEAQLEKMPCLLYGSGSNGYLSAAPRSQHVGGVNVVFMDGHNGFLSDSVEELTMAYLVSAWDGRAYGPQSLER